MADATEIKKGQRVNFFRTHDKTTKLVGKVVDFVEGLVHIKTEAPEGSVSRLEEAHPADVTPIADEEKPAEEEKKTARDSKRGAA